MKRVQRMLLYLLLQEWMVTTHFHHTAAAPLKCITFVRISFCSGCYYPLLLNSYFPAATIFAYGQTSSGKTFTMRGITENAVNDIFEHIKHVSYLKLYISKIYLVLFSETNYISFHLNHFVVDTRKKFSFEIFSFGNIQRDCCWPFELQIWFSSTLGWPWGIVIALSLWVDLYPPIFSANVTFYHLCIQKGTTVEKLVEEVVKDSVHLRQLIGICEGELHLYYYFFILYVYCLHFHRIWSDYMGLGLPYLRRLPVFTYNNGNEWRGKISAPYYELY